MRPDLFVQHVLDKCAALKRAGFWLPEPEVRPSLWLANFDHSDRLAAAVLLDRFQFYNQRMTLRLLNSAWQSLADAQSKGPQAPGMHQILAALPDAICTRVDGEHPRPTDSGNLFCRLARADLAIPDERFAEPSQAVLMAARGKPVIFFDDFVGSGDQFISTWKRNYPGGSFFGAQRKSGFVAIYIVLVATSDGLSRIHRECPTVAISAAHVLDQTSTIFGIHKHPQIPTQDPQKLIKEFLRKYENHISPGGDFPADDPLQVRHGYAERGLMFAFEHSVPDSTLPIFWAPGIDTTWTPLRKRA